MRQIIFLKWMIKLYFLLRRSALNTNKSYPVMFYFNSIVSIVLLKIVKVFFTKHKNFVYAFTRIDIVRE